MRATGIFRRRVATVGWGAAGLRAGTLVFVAPLLGKFLVPVEDKLTPERGGDCKYIHVYLHLYCVPVFGRVQTCLGAHGITNIATHGMATHASTVPANVVSLLHKPHPLRMILYTTEAETRTGIAREP